MHDDTRDPQADAAAARRLLRSQDSGVLCTLSQELPGYPFGSVTPYVLAHTGQVAVFVSAIAQHTANMRAEPKVCLTVVEEATGNQQAAGRVTVIGDAAPVPEASVPGVQARYFNLFPEARDYGQAHTFEFFWIEVQRVRYIAGFGQIFWVEPPEWAGAIPEWSAQEPDILEHMNADHPQAVGAIARRGGADPSEGARLVAVDLEGCHVQVGPSRLYVPFADRAVASDDVRRSMIELARTD
jgi:heme oxygenase (biliverdin-IX-beta and delta-forming)